MYKRKWILFAVFILTGAVILVLIHTVDRKPVTSKDPANSHTLSKVGSLLWYDSVADPAAG